MSYATPDELRLQINKTGNSGTASDDALQILLDAASEAIDWFCNRPDGFTADTTASARYYTGLGKPYLYIDECVEITTVAVKDSASDTTYTAWDTPTTMFAGDGDWLPFRGDHRKPNFNRLPYTGLMTDPNGDYATFTNGSYVTRGGFPPVSDIPRGVPTVKVTAKWGYAVTAPVRVKETCMIQAARWFKRGEGSWADMLSSADMGQPQFGQVLDKDLEFLLKMSRLVKPQVG